MEHTGIDVESIFSGCFGCSFSVISAPMFIGGLVLINSGLSLSHFLRTPGSLQAINLLFLKELVIFFGEKASINGAAVNLGICLIVIVLPGCETSQSLKD